MKNYKRVRSFIGKYFLGGVFCVFVLIGVSYAQNERGPSMVRKEHMRLMKELQLNHPYRSTFQLSDSSAWLSFAYNGYILNDSNSEDKFVVIVKVIGHSTIRDSLIWRLQHRVIYSHHLKYKLKDIETSFIIDTTTDFKAIEKPAGIFLLGNSEFTMRKGIMKYRFGFRDRDTTQLSNQPLKFKYNYSFDSLAWGWHEDSLVSSNYASVGDSNNNVPQTFVLYQNYPNPFNPITTIRYRLAAECYVSLKIYDMLGKEVVELVNGFEQEGEKSVLWNASDVASGAYFYRLSTVKKTSEGLSHAEAFTDVKKMIVLH